MKACELRGPWEPRIALGNFAREPLNQLSMNENRWKGFGEIVPTLLWIESENSILGGAHCCCLMLEIKEIVATKSDLLTPSNLSKERKMFNDGILF